MQPRRDVDPTLDAVRHPIVVAAGDGTITTVNTAAVRLARRSRDDLVGGTVSSLVRLPRHAHRAEVHDEAIFRELVRHASVGHGTAEVDVLAMGAHIREMRVTVSALDGDVSGASGWVLTIGPRIGERTTAHAHRDRLWDVVPDLISVVGRDGYFVDVNPAWSALGYDAEELFAHDFLEVIHEEDRERAVDEMLALQGDKAFTLDFTCRMRERDGGSRWYQWSAIYDPYTDTVSGVGHDVSHVLRRNQQLNQQVRSLRWREKELLDEVRDVRAAEQATSDAVVRMSHEVRTPLSSVIGFAGLLAENPEGNLTEQNLGSLERIRRNGLHVLGLIEDVLEANRTRAFDPDETGPVDLRAAVDEAVAQTAGIAEAKGVAVRVEGPADPAPIEAKHQALVRVLINLIGNALKYSDHEPVAVTLHEAPDGSVDRVDVVDRGPGIATVDHDDVFTPFWRSSDAEATSDGSGLGLPIARSLCREMGFELVFESAEDAGSTFSVLLAPDAEPPPRRDR
jgi:PAS domain S-box-containing protein